MRRDFNVASDRWTAGDLSYTLYTQVPGPWSPMPDPEAQVPGTDEALKQALVLAVLAQRTVDNRGGVLGIGDGLHQGLLTDAPGAWACIGFDPLGSLNDPHPINRSAMRVPWGFIVAEVPAGEHSLEVRDHPDAAQRIGVPRADGSRCEGGREITTYDCLDPSIGQASGNTCIAGKAWAACVILQHLFSRLDHPGSAERAHQQARRAASTVAASATADGRIPALLADGGDAVVLPVIEGLVYPWFAGCREALHLDGEYAAYLQALARHMTEHVLHKRGCLYPDGGWRITSRSSNTFPAKAYVCQFVARDLAPGHRRDQPPR